MDPSSVVPELSIYITRTSISYGIIRGTGWIGKHWLKISTERPRFHLLVCLIFSISSLKYMRSDNIGKPFSKIINLHLCAAILYIALSILGICEYPEEFPGIIQKLQRNQLDQHQI